MVYELIYSVSYRKALIQKKREMSEEWRKEWGEGEKMDDIRNVGMTFISKNVSLVEPREGISLRRE